MLEGHVAAQVAGHVVGRGGDLDDGVVTVDGRLSRIYEYFDTGQRETFLGPQD